MYNRYIRNDHGAYTRIPEEEPFGQPPPAGGEKASSFAATDGESTPSGAAVQSSPPAGSDRPLHTADPLPGILRHILDQLHLDSVDTGDLLLLAILFFLFREGADEELLAALGLLLIL